MDIVSRLITLQNETKHTKRKNKKKLVLVLPDRVTQMVSAESRGIVLGSLGSVAGLLGGIIAPVAGTHSDRTSSRYGRRTPWVIGV